MREKYCEQKLHSSSRFIRNALTKVAKKDRGIILAHLREITGSSSLESARKQLREAVDVPTNTHPKVAELLDGYSEELLAVHALPKQHRKRMKSSTILERFNRKLKRRIRGICVFPNEQSCVRRVSALPLNRMKNGWNGNT